MKTLTLIGLISLFLTGLASEPEVECNESIPANCDKYVLNHESDGCYCFDCIRNEEANSYYCLQVEALQSLRGNKAVKDIIRIHMDLIRSGTEATEDNGE